MIGINHYVTAIASSMKGWTDTLPNTGAQTVESVTQTWMLFA